jgi:hypothetical protein
MTPFNDHDYEGGANGPSLNQARDFFHSIRVSDPKLKGSERSPRPDEMPPLANQDTRISN